MLPSSPWTKTFRTKKMTQKASLFFVAMFISAEKVTYRDIACFAIVSENFLENCNMMNLS